MIMRNSVLSFLSMISIGLPSVLILWFANSSLEQNDLAIYLCPKSPIQFQARCFRFWQLLLSSQFLYLFNLRVASWINCRLLHVWGKRSSFFSFSCSVHYLFNFFQYQKCISYISRFIYQLFLQFNCVWSYFYFMSNFF